MKPYKLSLVQALTNDEEVMRRAFCKSMLEIKEDDEIIFSRQVFRDEATFHLINSHNSHILETHQPHEALESQ